MQPLVCALEFFNRFIIIMDTNTLIFLGMMCRNVLYKPSLYLSLQANDKNILITHPVKYALEYTSHPWNRFCFFFFYYLPVHYFFFFPSFFYLQIGLVYLF